MFFDITNATLGRSVVGVTGGPTKEKICYLRNIHTVNEFSLLNFLPPTMHRIIGKIEKNFFLT